MTGRTIGPAGLAALLLASAASLWAASAGAQIVTDGTVGATATLAGPHITIGAALGTQRGGNLFHSFSAFSVPAGGSALFAGPDGVRNVVARVTGGQASAIDGTLGTTIAGANLFLLNPAGIRFGSGAGLSLSGSFHASTADALVFADGARYEARTPSGSVLTVAEPAAFGFAGSNPGAITVTGGTLAVGTGRALSLVGGDVTLDGGARLSAPAGTLTLAAMGGSGAVPLADPLAATAARSGGVTVRNGAAASTDGDGGGAVRITGGRLTVTGGGVVSANNTGATDATAGVSVGVSDVTVSDAGQITAHAAGSGQAGTIAIDTGGTDPDTGGTVRVLGDGRTVNTLIAARALRGSTARAGRITVRAGTVTITYGGQMTTSSLSTGDAGEIAVTAGRTVLSHQESGYATGTGLFSLAPSMTGGAAGSITVNGGTLELYGGAQVSTRSGGQGRAGIIDVTVDRLVVHGHIGVDSSMITSQGTGSGDGGTITIVADSIMLIDGGRITSNARGTGDGGTITVTARTIEMAQGSEDVQTGIGSRANPGSSGSGGTITVTADSLSIASGARITTSTAGEGSAGTIRITAGTIRLDGTGQPAGSITGIASSAESPDTAGAGGAITVTAGDITIANGATVQASSYGGGAAGDITIAAGRSLTIRGGTIATATTRSDGGNIVIDGGELARMSGGQITTSVAGGAGNGGNITAEARTVVLNHATVSANAWGGRGGNITVTAETVLASPDTRVEASSRLGVSGEIVVQGVDGTAGLSMVPLETEYVDAAGLLRSTCATRAGDSRSSTFTGSGRGGLPPSPDGPLLAGAETRGAARTACAP